MKIMNLKFSKVGSLILIVSLAVSLAVLIATVPPMQVSGQKNKVEPLLVLHRAHVPSLSFDGNRLAVGREVGRVEVYDVGSGAKLATFREAGSDVGAISADGKRVAIFGGPRFAMYDVDTGKRVSEASVGIFEGRDEVGFVKIWRVGGLPTPNFSSDLGLVADRSRPKNGDIPNPREPAVIIGDLQNRTLHRSLSSDDGFAKGDYWDRITMTPNGERVASTRRNSINPDRNRTVVWDVETGKTIFSLPFSSYGFSLSDDGSRLVSTRPDDLSKIEIWDVKSGTRVSELSSEIRGKKVKINQMALSPDGKLLVTTRDAAFHFWDTTTGKYLASQDQEKVSEDWSKVAVFSGDGKRIAVGTYADVISIWSVDEILKKRR